MMGAGERPTGPVKCQGIQRQDLVWLSDCEKLTANGRQP